MSNAAVEHHEYPNRPGEYFTDAYPGGPNSFEYAVDVARLAYAALLKARIGIKAGSFEGWQQQYGLRFQAALRKLRYEALEIGNRAGTLQQQLHNESIGDAWNALKQAESIIESFLSAQQP